MPFLDRRHSSCLWAVYKSITLEDLHKTDDNNLISSVLLQQAGKLFLIVLGWSWLGDLFLMGEGHLFLLSGIFSFWGAQLCYLQLIAKEIRLPFKKPFFTKEALLPLILFGGYFVGTMSLLGAKLGMLSFHVSGYALNLATIGAVSILLWRKKKSSRTLALLFGVVLFIASDSIIAFNTFYFQEEILSMN